MPESLFGGDRRRGGIQILVLGMIRHRGGGDFLGPALGGGL